MKRIHLFILVAALGIPGGCNSSTDQSGSSAPSGTAAPPGISPPASASTPDDSSLAEMTGSGNRPLNADLAEARRGFTTNLNRRGPAPQQYQEVTAPAGVQEVYYNSGELKLKAWLSDDPGDGIRRPAVVYLHGGWAFAPVDWQDAVPFVEAGYVLMMPMLRGENGNPGIYEGFYGEVDDAIAAGRHVANLSYVDSDNIFVAGHSVGGALAMLAAMLPSKYKAAAALSGNLDMAEWSRGAHPARVVHDLSDPDELRLRNPMAFAASLQIPVILYSEQGNQRRINAAFRRRAKQSGKACELMTMQGDHGSMVAPSVQHAIKWFRNQMEN